MVSAFPHGWRAVFRLAVVASEIIRHPGGIVGIPLTEVQQARARRFLTAFPQMPF